MAKNKSAIQERKWVAKERENDFEEGNHFYRFLEHEPFISKCFNFRGATNDTEPKAAAAVCDRLTKIMCAILESYASEERRHVDYVAISKSEEFRRYVNMTQDLQRVNLLELSENETLAFFLNLYNSMVVHAMIRVGCQEGVINRRSFSDFHYLIGGHPYSLSTIKNGILLSSCQTYYCKAAPCLGCYSKLVLKAIRHKQCFLTWRSP
uniref:DUF547 domain-containing protein n=2 Tax=Cajanus cajan TaxID=3821 RepID=A0A151TEJ4_CAJCA|nr:hypothetical protein KK1_011682 [Cajanus cajan]